MTAKEDTHFLIDNAPPKEVEFVLRTLSLDVSYSIEEIRETISNEWNFEAQKDLAYSPRRLFDLGLATKRKTKSGKPGYILTRLGQRVRDILSIDVELYADILIETSQKGNLNLTDVLIQCLICKSKDIRSNGTQSRVKIRINCYNCDNPSCSFRNISKGGKLFTIFSSFFINFILQSYLDSIFSKLFHAQGKLSDIARNHHLSPQLMSYLY